MNEQAFLMQLDQVIKDIPSEERKDILHDYQEHFAVAREEGKTDEQIVDALGSPEKIGKEILAMYHVNQAETKTTTGNMLRAVWAGIGLGIFNLIIVLGPFIALVSVVIAGWISSTALALSPLLLPINLIIYPGTFLWSDVFFFITSSGIGILLGVIMFYLTKGFTWIFTRYLRFNVSLVKGGLKA